MEEMQNSKESIQELTKVTMLLFDNFQRENQTMIGRMAKLDQEVRQTLNQSQKAIENTAEMTQKQLATTIERIIDEKLDQKMDDLEKDLRARTNQLQEAFDYFASERRHLAKQTWIISWKGILGMAVGMAIMIIASFTATWNEKKKRDAMVEEYKAAKVQTQMITVEDKLIKSKCGDNVCIQIDTKAGNWGENGEYAIPVFKD